MIETLGYNKNNKDRQKNDYYATPPEEVKNVLQYEDLEGVILDNSCGEGHLIKEVAKKYYNTVATDLINRGYGEGGLDFLSDDYRYNDVDTIIMNPPFKLIEEFVNKSLEIASKKVVMLARTQFLESQSRYKNIFKYNKPSKVYLYVDRISCAKNGNFDDSSNSMTFAWFVWDKQDDSNKTELEWIRRWDKQ